MTALDPTDAAAQQSIGGYRSVDGTAVQRTVARAAASTADLLASMFGPWGAYTFVADSEHGDPVVTQDPIRACRPLALSHPIERLLYGLARDQRDAHGDGALSATLLCAAVLERCADLIADRGLHPRTVDAGLAAAGDMAREAVADAGIRFRACPEDARFRSVVRTQAATWFPDMPDHYATVITDALTTLAQDGTPTDAGGLSLRVDDHVHQFVHDGGSRLDTRLVDGVLIETDVLNEASTRVTDATVATVDQKLYLETVDDEHAAAGGTPTTQVSSPADRRAQRATEDAVHRRLVEPLLAAGVDALVARKGIDERVSQVLRREGVLVVRRAKPEDILESVAAATGATVVGDVRDLDPGDLGTAPVVEEIAFGPLAYTRVAGSAGASAVSILVRAGTWTGAEAAGQGLDCALQGAASALREPVCVPGGGAAEVAVARHLRDRAPAAGDRTALVLEAVADALADLVATLARNCGLDPTAVLPDIRADEAHRRGLVAWNDTRRVADVVDAGVLDPIAVRRGAIMAALASARHAVTVDQLFLPR